MQLLGVERQESNEVCVKKGSPKVVRDAEFTSRSYRLAVFSSLLTARKKQPEILS